MYSKTIKAFTSMIAMLMILLCIPFQALAAGYESATVELPVTLEVNGEDIPEAEYTFEITSEDGSPLPENNVLTMTEAGEAAFDGMEYTLPGDYHYTVKQTTEQQEYFLYDETTYKITVRVTNGDGYTLNTEVWAEIDGEESKPEKIAFTNRYIGRASISVSKVMTYLDNPVGSDMEITFYCALFSEADGNYVSRVTDVQALEFPTDNGVATTEFTDLRNGTYYLFETDEAGNLITDHVSTADNPEGYLIVPSGDNGAKVEITNDERRYNLELENMWGEVPPNEYDIYLTEHTVKKVWENVPEGTEVPTIEVQLYKDGEEYGLPITLSEESGWTYTWTQLPKYEDNDPTKDECIYNVEEVENIEGYDVDIDETAEDTTVITNTYAVEPTPSTEPSTNPTATPSGKTDPTPTPKSTPVTGDSFNLSLWIAIMACAVVIAIAAVIVYVKRRKTE